MLNIIITLFIFVLLVTQKILLLNEESLILLCFITFIFVSMNNLGESLSLSLQNQSLEIKQNLTNSLNKLLLSLKNFSILNNNFKSIVVSFKKFKDYYKQLIILLTNLTVNYNTRHLASTYNKKLIFINKIEEQTVKLLTTVIIKRLNSIIKIKYFYNTSLKLNTFLSIDKILLRECIQLINSEKN